MSGKKLLVLLAAGFSRRFGPENKLLHELDGLPLYRHTLDKLAALRDEETDVLVMTNTPEIQAYCTGNGIRWSPSPEAAEGIAATVRAAVCVCIFCGRSAETEVVHHAGVPALLHGAGRGAGLREGAHGARKSGLVRKAVFWCAFRSPGGRRRSVDSGTTLKRSAFLSGRTGRSDRY